MSWQFDAAKLRKLRPSFKETGGTVTAGNASSIRSIFSSQILFVVGLFDFIYGYEQGLCSLHEEELNLQ